MREELYDPGNVLFEKFKEKSKVVQNLIRINQPDKEEDENVNNNDEEKQSISTLTQKQPLEKTHPKDDDGFLESEENEKDQRKTSVDKSKLTNSASATRRQSSVKPVQDHRKISEDKSATRKQSSVVDQPKPEVSFSKQKRNSSIRPDSSTTRKNVNEDQISVDESIKKLSEDLPESRRNSFDEFTEELIKKTLTIQEKRQARAKTARMKKEAKKKKVAEAKGQIEKQFKTKLMSQKYSEANFLPEIATVTVGGVKKPDPRLKSGNIDIRNKSKPMFGGRLDSRHKSALKR